MRANEGDRAGVVMIHRGRTSIQKPQEVPPYAKPERQMRMRVRESLQRLLR